MKKIIIGLLCLFTIEYVNAIDITNDVELKYKWYKNDVSEELYYPKQEKLPDYLEDINNIKYGTYSDWDNKYCSYSDEDYLIEEKIINTYEKVKKTKYIKIELLEYTTDKCSECIHDIKVYYNGKSVNYTKLQDDRLDVKLELPEEYDSEKLWFYIDAERRYIVYMSNDINLQERTLSYHTFSDKVLIPDESWITSATKYTTIESDHEIESNPFVKNIKTIKVCRVSEIETYRYKLERNYYDDNYHKYIEGYIPDINDFIVNYTKTLPKEIVEIAKEKETMKENDEETENSEKKEVNSLSEIDESNNTMATDDLEISQNNTIHTKRVTAINRTNYKDNLLERTNLNIYLLITWLTLIMVAIAVTIKKKKVD